jgi:hypothetical protein
MGLPPAVKSILPSLQVKRDRTATLDIADIKRQFPSLRISKNRREVTDGSTITLSVEDLRKLLRIALAGVAVDERWYLTHVPELGKAIGNGHFESPAEHYFVHGYLEGRLPQEPVVDEEYYRKTYPDIEQAIRSGKLKSAYEHYIKSGYTEGRSPMPTTQARQRVEAAPAIANKPRPEPAPKPGQEPVPNSRAAANGSVQPESERYRRVADHPTLS